VPALSLGSGWTRRAITALALLAVTALATGVPRTTAQTPQPVQGPSAVPASSQAAAIDALARQAMADNHLNTVILRVTVDGHDVLTEALGESMTGVPATTDMHFRNGAVAISYMSTLLLELVDQGRVSLDDKLSTWLPDVPNADKVTLKMLANMTAGYYDFEGDPGFQASLYQDPFRQWTTQERLAISFAKPQVFEPGTNWGYAHTDYVILGQALEKIMGEPLDVALQQNVLGPLGLTNTENSTTPAIPEPALHAFSSERRQALGIDPATPFYEESSFWNPSWTLAEGAIQTTNIYDMTTTADAIGTGKLLSPASHAAQVDPNLLGFGSPVPGCKACFTQTEAYNYGLGVVRHGSWLLQNPLFYGYAAVEGYYPPKQLAVAVATTFGPGAFDAEGNYNNAAQTIFQQIAEYLAPDDPRLPSDMGN
jgi:CubicO group peptidase (beta-lactamase class C family)